jgi:cysteine-rich secretory family protein
MTASQPLPGTTSSPPVRSVAAGLAAVLLASACLLTIVPAAAHAAKGHAARAGHARPLAHAARGCAPARGFLFKRGSVLRTQRRLLCLMNRARARYGLRPLRTNRCLHRVAARHAHDMVNRRYFAHTTPNGRDPGQRARASGYVPRRAAWMVGENIAWGVAGAARPNWVVRAWMHSPPHRHNILSRRFRDVGIGVARGVPVHGFRGVPLRATFSVEFGAHHGRTRCG